MLEESLGSRVCCEQGRWSPAAEGTHGKDKTPLARLHTGSNNLRDFQRAQTVDGDDILKLLLLGEKEGRGDAMRLSDIVDENGNVQIIHELSQDLVILVVICAEVHGMDLGLKAAKFGFELLGERFELGLGSGHKDEVEAFGGQLCRKLLAEAVRCTCDNSPSALFAIFAQL